MSRSRIAVCAVSLLLLAGVTEAQTTREVSYNPRSVVRINAKLRFTTMIILPEQEQILDFVCGDKEFWVVSGTQNLAYVKPAKAGASTNLNLVTASGNVYSFLLTEGTAEADLKLYVVPDRSMKGVGEGARKFYAAAEVDELRHTADAAKKDAQAARDDAAKTVDERINAFKASYPTHLTYLARLPPRVFLVPQKLRVGARIHRGAAVPDLVAEGYALMMYFYPFSDSVLVELRRELPGIKPTSSGRWWLRNAFWRRLGPMFTIMIARASPSSGIEHAVRLGYDRVIRRLTCLLVGGKRTRPHAQIIRHQDKPGRYKFVFSMWSFDEAGFFDKLEAYHHFCRDYAARTGLVRVIDASS